MSSTTNTFMTQGLKTIHYQGIRKRTQGCATCRSSAPKKSGRKTRKIKKKNKSCQPTPYPRPPIRPPAASWTGSSAYIGKINRLYRKLQGGNVNLGVFDPDNS